MSLSQLHVYPFTRRCVVICSMQDRVATSTGPSRTEINQCKCFMVLAVNVFVSLMLRRVVTFCVQTSRAHSLTYLLTYLKTSHPTACISTSDVVRLAVSICGQAHWCNCNWRDYPAVRPHHTCSLLNLSRTGSSPVYMLCTNRAEPALCRCSSV